MRGVEPDFRRQARQHGVGQALRDQHDRHDHRRQQVGGQRATVVGAQPLERREHARRAHGVKPPGGLCGLCRQPARLEARPHVAGHSPPGHGIEDRLRIEMARLGQRPERGRARAGAAEGEHRPLELGQRVGERRDVVVGDLARDHREVPVGEADPLGRSGASWRPPAGPRPRRPGAVADHRAEARAASAPRSASVICGVTEGHGVSLAIFMT